MNGYRFDRLKILVVDDNAHMRRLVTTILRAFGVSHIHEAASGEQAWAILCEANPDLVLLDWLMPGLSGPDLAQRIRAHPAAPDPFVPVIMLTAHTSIEHMRRARDVGINEFIAKPVSVQAIMSRLVAAIERPRPFVRTSRYFGPCRRNSSRVRYRGPERRAAIVEQAAE